MLDFLLQFVEKIDKFLNWKFLTLCFFATLIILFAIHIPFICNILEPMYTTIRISLVLIWLFSFVGIVYKSLDCIFMQFKNKFEQKKLERQNELEHEQQKIKFENTMKSLLASLSPKEIAILKFMLNEDGCMTWLPVTDITVLSLVYKKCLLPIFTTSIICGDLLNSKSCFAYTISPDLLSYIKAHFNVLNSQWENISSADYLKIYQQQLE